MCNAVLSHSEFVAMGFAMLVFEWVVVGVLMLANYSCVQASARDGRYAMSNNAEDDGQY